MGKSSSWDSTVIWPDIIQWGIGEQIVSITTISTKAVSGEAAERGTTSLLTDWAPAGNCVTTDPDALFVRGAAQQQAKLICGRCPVVAECLADALDNRTEFGVWGGMTERERRAMLRRHPKVTSWWTLFNSARVAESGATKVS